MTVLTKDYPVFRIPESESIPETSTNNYIISLSFRGFSRARDAALSLGYINEISEENREIINQINSFENFKDNWDGLNAKRIPNTSIELAKKIVLDLNNSNSNVYLTSPGPNEEIMLLLQSNTRELEIIIYPHKQKFVQFENNEFIDQGNFDIEKISALSEWIG